jgi:biopolymer transport protein ExbD
MSQEERLKAQKVYRKLQRRVPEPDGVSHLNITPMMDMMTILLLFFLQNFSLEQKITPDEEMTPPKSRSKVKRTKALQVLVTKKKIVVEGKQIVLVKNGEVDSSVKRDGQSGFLITPLLDNLQKHATRLKKLAKIGYTDRFKGDIVLIADHTTPYRLISEVLYTAGQAEFGQYRLLVLK